MVTDQQVRRLLKLGQTEMNFGMTAAKAGMDEKTARKYRKLGKLPSEIMKDHRWRTREVPFQDVWPEVKLKLELIPGVEGKTLPGLGQIFILDNTASILSHGMGGSCF